MYSAPQFYYGSIDFGSNIQSVENDVYDYKICHLVFLKSVCEICIIYVMILKNCSMILSIVNILKSQSRKTSTKLASYMIMDTKGEATKSADAKSRSLVGQYDLTSEDQKLIYCINQIIPLIDQEDIAKTQHRKSIFNINTNPLRAMH